MDDFKIGQLTKEMVVVRLKNMGDPCAAAAEVLKKTLLVALKDTKPGDSGYVRVIREACEGAMMGLLVMEQNLPVGAVRMLEAIGEASAELNLDPAAMMEGGLEGIADMHRFLTGDQMDAIHHEIDTSLMGAGDAFYAVCSSLAQTETADQKVEKPES